MQEKVKIFHQRGRLGLKTRRYIYMLWSHIVKASKEEYEAGNREAASILQPRAAKMGGH